MADLFQIAWGARFLTQGSEVPAAQVLSCHHAAPTSLAARTCGGVAGDRSSCQVWVFQHSGDEAEGWEGTVMTLGALHIFFIYHLSKREGVTLVLKVTPLNVFVTAQETFYWFTEWCRSLMEWEGRQQAGRSSLGLQALFLQRTFSSPYLGLSHLCSVWFSAGCVCILADPSCALIVPLHFPSLCKALHQFASVALWSQICAEPALISQALNLHPGWAKPSL